MNGFGVNATVLWLQDYVWNLAMKVEALEARVKELEDKEKSPRSE